MDNQFDEMAFVNRADNALTFTLSLDQYHTLINGLFPVENGKVLELINALMAVGEPQKKTIVERYETEKTAFEATQKKEAA